MGGIGSGRRYRTDEVKPIVESNISLNLTQLKKQGPLAPGQCFEIDYSKECHQLMTLMIVVEEESLALKYIYNGVLRNQTIEIVGSKCFGRHYRQYLVCPVCGARRNQLYLDSTGKFSCRVCINLGYRTQRLNPHMRHAYTAEKLRQEKLKILEGCPNTFMKPKHMRTKTYHNLVDRIIWHEKKSSELFMVYFRNIKGKFDGQNLAGSPAA